MSGVKGRSGRQSKLTEDIRKLVLDRSWFELHKYLIDPKVDAKEKCQFAVHLAGKNIPQEIKAEIARAKHQKFEGMTDEEILTVVKNEC